MKKTLLCLAAAVMVMTSANAQKKLADLNILNHLAVGLNVGTTGIGADVAVPCTKFVEIQAGFSIMPKITYSTNIHTNATSYLDASLKEFTLGNDLDNIPIQGKLNMVNGKVMINLYPVPTKGFHITVGAYFGKGDIVEVYNTTKGQLNAINTANKLIDEYNAIAPTLNRDAQEHIGLKLGDYLLTPDAEGNAKATLRTNGFKPYVGIGFGRAVPKRRLNFKFDLGAMFWGSPDVIDHNNVSLTKQDWDGKDGGAFRIISKFKVYPVLNFRLAGRIF